jgi:hypothetical protein
MWKPERLTAEQRKLLLRLVEREYPRDLKIFRWAISTRGPV